MGESGLALFSTGSTWSKNEPDVSGPANTTNCVFERNIATDGGGIYSAAGYDIIRDSWFEANLAGETMSNTNTRWRLAEHTRHPSLYVCLRIFHSNIIMR